MSFEQKWIGNVLVRIGEPVLEDGRWICRFWYNGPHDAKGNTPKRAFVGAMNLLMQLMLREDEFQVRSAEGGAPNLDVG